MKKDDDTTTTKKSTKAKRRSNHEGTIWRTDSGYRGRVALGRDPITGKVTHKWLRGSTRAEVVDAIQELKGKADKKRPLPNGKRTVEQYMLEWLDVHVRPSKAPSTLRMYEQHVRSTIIPALGHIQLDRLSGVEVQRFLNALYDSGKSPTTVKNFNATLKAALTTAKRWEYVDRNAAKDATTPKQIKYKPKPLAAAQGIKLLNVVIQHRYEAVFYVALLEGLRRGEVAGLQWDDVDFEMGYLTVRHGLQRVKGRGAVLSGVKSDASERRIPLLPVVAGALRRRKERQEQERLAAGESWKQDGDFVFTSRDGGRMMPEEPVRELKGALKLAGLPDIRFHDLRHSTAIILQALGVDLKTIQIILGHSTFQITADFYAQGVSSEVVAATQKLNALFERSLIAENEQLTLKTVARTVASATGETIN